MPDGITIAALARALIASGADSVHARAGEIPALTHGLTTRPMADTPLLDDDGMHALARSLLPAEKLALVAQGHPRRLTCRLGQLGSFVAEVHWHDGLTLTLAPAVGEAEVAAALKPVARRPTGAHPVLPPEPAPPEAAPEPPPAPPVETRPLRTGRLPGRRTAIVLAIFFGPFGIHHMYLGRRLAGWASLLLYIGSGGLAGIPLGILASRDAFAMWRMDDEKFADEFHREK